MTVVEKRTVLVGIRMDSRSRELLNWALVKVAEPGDRVVAVHVCREPTSKDKLLLDDYIEVYEGLCDVKKVDLSCQAVTGSSIRKVLVRQAKIYSAAAIVVGINRQNALRCRASMARYCARRLPQTTQVVAIHDGKVVFRSCSSNLLPGLQGDPKPSFYSITIKESQSEFGGSEVPETEKPGIVHENKKRSFGSISLLLEDLAEHGPGWPLFQRAGSLTSSQCMEARELSVVQWVMALPSRSPPQTPQKGGFFSGETQNPSEREDVDSANQSIELGVNVNNEQPEELERFLLKYNSSTSLLFSYEVLKASTSHFSSENLIGKGGCNRVYKGILPNGKPVAIKIRKASKEAWKDFVQEVEIISSLKHKNITPLLGICIKDKDLASVYDFFPRGSLEEFLDGNNKESSVLPWKERFNIAERVAEALNYLHNECSKPVIHRDVKSSNILLSDAFEPRLSDFGLAIWRPTASFCLTQNDVVGTFGYLAPEYFMYGKISDKLDVYSFGVVLLELLSGRKSIGSEIPRGQESLVMWAKPILDSGNPQDILDPNLKGNFDEVQVHRMVRAAVLCITRRARLRPTMIQVLKLLRGENNDTDKCVISQNDDQEDFENKDENDDEVYPDSSVESHLSLAFLDVDDESTSLPSPSRRNSLSLEEYLKGRSRSSSFN